MIKYNLKCKCCSKKFDSWFSTSKEYEKLKKIKRLNCMYCNSTKVEKTLMSHNIHSSKNINNFLINDDKSKNIKKRIRDYQKFIKQNFEYVGDNFSYEARTLHYKNKKNSKSIYGKASQKEITELKEEGIDTDIIPWFEDKEN